MRKLVNGKYVGLSQVVHKPQTPPVVDIDRVDLLEELQGNGVKANARWKNETLAEYAKRILHISVRIRGGK